MTTEWIENQVNPGLNLDLDLDVEFFFKIKVVDGRHQLTFQVVPRSSKKTKKLN